MVNIPLNGERCRAPAGSEGGLLNVAAPELPPPWYRAAGAAVDAEHLSDVWPLVTGADTHFECFSGDGSPHGSGPKLRGAVTATTPADLPISNETLLPERADCRDRFGAG